MTTTKSQMTFFLGIIFSLMGVMGLLLNVAANDWSRMLVVTGLVLVNAGLFWMGQLLPDQKR